MTPGRSRTDDIREILAAIGREARGDQRVAPVTRPPSEAVGRFRARNRIERTNPRVSKEREPLERIAF